jgi:hypothetical protein
MSRLIHYIDFYDGNNFVEVTPPIDWKGLEIELAFDQDKARLSTNALRFVGDTAEMINDYVSGAIGTVTTPGIFEGPAYKPVLECGNQSYDLFSACLELSAPDALYSCDEVQVPIQETGNIDFLDSRIDSFRFEYLAGLSSSTPGYISPSDYVDVWYMVGKYPQNMEIMMGSLTLFITLKETYEGIKRIGDCIAAIAGGATGAVESAAQIIFLVAYLALLITALINLIQKLIALIFPFVYYHRGMKEITLWQRGCAYLGLAFSSTIYTGSIANCVIIPPKNNAGERVGNPSTEVGYYDGTFGDFIRCMIEKYNGAVKVIGNTVHFEIKDSQVAQATYSIPVVEGFEFVGYATDEVPSNYTIEYAYDGIDLHDYDAPAGRLLQVVTEPALVQNKKNITLKGLESRVINMSLPKVKTTTSDLEIVMAQVFNGFAGLVNAVASIFGASNPPIPTIPPGANINVLQLDSHFIGIHKNIVYLGGGKTDPLTNATIGVHQLLQDYHYPRIGKAIYHGSIGNQWWRYKGRVPMCCEEWLQIRDNNYGYYQGDQVKLTSVKWKEYDDIAEIEFKVNKKFTDNLKVSVVIPGQSTIIL